MSFFVRITPRSARERLDGALYGSDLSEKMLMDRVVTPYRQGQSITLGGRTILASDISELRITFAGDVVGGTPMAQIRALRPGPRPLGDHIARHGENVTDRYIEGPPSGVRQRRPKTRPGTLRARIDWTRSKLKTPIGAIVATVGLLGAIASIVALVHMPNGSLAPEEARLLSLIPPKVGWHCRPEATVIASRYKEAVAASAVCTPVDRGPESLYFDLFTTETEMRMVEELESRRAKENGVGCDGDFTTSLQPWVDASGRPRGEMFCSDVHRNIHWTHLTWSDDRTLILAGAGAEPYREDALHRWWQRDVRFDGRGPAAKNTARLMSLIALRTGPCRGEAILPPAALAAVQCAPDRGLRTAGGFLFAGSKTLRDYFATRSAPRAALAGESCRVSPLGFTSYQGAAPNHRSYGKLLCYRAGGNEWFEWIDQANDTYAFASRAASQWRRLYREWSEALGV
jgi:hypothetical protein